MRLSWIDNLVSFWASFANTAALWAYNATTWVWPLNQLRGFFVSLSTVVDNIFGAFLDFREWVYDLADLLDEIFDWQNVVDWISRRLDDLSGLINWFDRWYDNVTSVIDKSLEAFKDYVFGLIDTATARISAALVSLDNFFTTVLPTLFDLQFAEEWWRGKIVDVGQLISSAFIERSDLWAGWSEFRQSVSDIVTAPFDWLESKFTDWFLGGE